MSGRRFRRQAASRPPGRSRAPRQPTLHFTDHDTVVLLGPAVLRRFYGAGPYQPVEVGRIDGRLGRSVPWISPLTTADKTSPTREPQDTATALMPAAPHHRSTPAVSGPPATAQHPVSTAPCSDPARRISGGPR